jgi:hypothetical protein
MIRQEPMVYNIAFIPLLVNMRRKYEGLETIPGVGKKIAQDLRSIGIDRPSCLKGKNPEFLYKKLCKRQGKHIDRCMLYVFRCAVYYASHERHDPALLKWWHWKDLARSEE